MATPSASRQFAFLGPPGSGKGTQAKALAGALGVSHISTGDLFRAAVTAGGELGQQVDGLLEAGQLVPDEVTNKVVAERLTQPDVTNGFVLDGYPRNLTQANYLADLVPQAQVLLIELSDGEAVQRIAGRRTCSQCGAIYHVTYQPPAVPGVCDARLPDGQVCGGKLIQRSDETESVVRGRLALYHRETEPVVEYYRARGQLTQVDGSLSIPAVTQSLRHALGLA